MAERKHTIAFALSVLMAFAYATTMNPTVSFIDTGELAAVASMLGIAHPTGYGLFSLLGRLAVIFPLGVPVILKLNVLGLLLVAASVGMFFELALLLQRSSVGQKRPKRYSREEEISQTVSAALGSMVFGLSTTVWAQSTAIEVYSLHLLFLMVVSIAFVKGLEETSETGSVSRWFMLFVFLLGLSFTNHMTTLLLAPAFLYLFFDRMGAARSSWILLFKNGPLFLLGFSASLYLPFRSSTGVPLDWGHPAEAERFLWHITGKQYRSWIFSGFESAKKQLEYFGDHFSSEFNILAIVLILTGIVVLVRERKKMFLFVSLLVLGCLAYSINYDIHDIDSYFLLAYVGSALFLVFGTQKMIMMIFRRPRIPQYALIVLLVVPLLQWFNNRATVDEADNTLVEDYTRNILSAVDSNAVILSYQWDYFVSASYYYQWVEGMRRDVVVVDKELLRRSWYLLQLEKEYPWLIERSRDAVETFKREVWKFEHDVPYDGNAIERAYNGMINDMIAKSWEVRPVYVGREMESQFAPGFDRVPEGLLLRLNRPGNALERRTPQVAFRPTRFRNRLTEGLLGQYLQMFTINAYFEKNRGNEKEALEWLDRVRTIGPAFAPAERLRSEIEGR